MNRAAPLGAEEKIEDDLPEPYHGYMDSDSEDSDSELSGREIDSDIEKEKEISYDRPVYKEDLTVSKEVKTLNQISKPLF